MKIVFIYQQLSSKTGGGIFTNVLLQSLRNINQGLLEYSYPAYKNGMDKLVNQLFLYSAGMTPKHESEFLSILSSNPIDVVVFNGSQLGNLVKKVKSEFPQIKSITIFHNLEYKFVWDAFKIRKNPAQLITLLATYINEKNSISYSDVIITLNKRDSRAIFSQYKREADCILPLCVADRFDANKIVKLGNKKVGAFVGSNFFANNKGIKWFCENVSNRINCKILVIGKGFEEEAEYFSHYPNIKLIGTVDNIDEYYYNVDFIVSPIFDGSGMKTKTAEALMFGQNIFATDEAFEGYDLDFKKVGALCNTAEEFIREIESFTIGKEKYNEYSRFIYERKYSQTVLEEILKQTINKVSEL